MYESFYGLREKPFSLLPDPAYLYLSKQHEMAITLLEYSLENQAGFCVITGKAGTGKTTLVRRLLNQIGDNVSVGLISNTHQSFGELLRWILHAFNLEAPDKNRAQLHQIFVDYLIEQYAKNRRTMLIIDEAQNMSADSLEELRMLSNINSEKDLVLQVVLVGQPPLREILQQPDLEQFAQRVAVDYHLESLSREETHGYIRHRIKVGGGERDLFTDDACDAVFERSGGIPRLINLLCDYSLVYAYAIQAAVVTGDLVEQVVSEREKYGALAIFSKEAHARQYLAVETARPLAVAKTANTMVAAHGAGNMPGFPAVHEVRSVISIDGLGKSQRDISAFPGRNPDDAKNPSLARHNQQMAGKYGPDEKISRTDRREHGIIAAPYLETPRQREVVPGSNQTVTNPIDSDATPVDMPEISTTDDERSPGSQAEIESESNRTTSVPSPATPEPARDIPPYAAGQGTAKEQTRVTGSPQKSGSGTSTLKRFFITVLLIALLVSAALVWRYFYQPLGSTSAIPDGASQVPAVGVNPKVEPARTVQANAPVSQADLADKPSVSKKTNIKTPMAENDSQAARLKLIERERDAALAKANAAERERDAVRAAAAAREQALVAEREAALVREREKEERLAREAEQAKQAARIAAEAAAAEKARQEAARAAAAARAAMPELTTPPPAAVVTTGATTLKAVTTGNPADESDVDEGNHDASDEPTTFTANPCKGPSARFLSTCQ